MIFTIVRLTLNAAKLKRSYSAGLALPIARELHISPTDILDFEIISSSIDSRRSTPKLLLTVKAAVRPGCSRVKPASQEELAALEIPQLQLPSAVSLKHPLVIGTGPAGISAAYLLALASCRPLIIDRGFPVEQREADYRDFLLKRQLNVNSNLLIGEGGAGTFSDGKLYTGTKDWRGRFLKHLWVQCGAPEEIMWQARPHIGSDRLSGMSRRLREKIIELGGTFRFNCEITDIITSGGRCTGVVTAGGEKITAPLVIFAPGLGGRELVRRILPKVEWELKPFQTGCRVEHPQELIDRAMYHLPHRPEALGAAEYHIVSRSKLGNVSSFCMCPGGTVVNASAWENHAVTNGMSPLARDGKFANSCLITTIRPETCGSAEELFAAMEDLERSIFEHGGRDYTFPAQDIAAFIAGRNGLKNRESSCDTGIIPGRMDLLLPEILKKALHPAIRNFERHIPGFTSCGKIIGAETFVSSPIRIKRDRETMQNPLLSGFYPAGEGCGLAGGIVSAGCDGLQAAEAALRNEGNFNA